MINAGISNTISDLKGAGYHGKKTEMAIDNFILYKSSVRTTENVALTIQGAEDWLQFHYQLSGETKTWIVEEKKEIAIGPNSFNILFQKHGDCEVRFPKETVYESFGFRVDPNYFVHSFLRDFNELAAIKSAIENETLFYIDRNYASLDVKTRDIIAKITDNPYQGDLQTVYIQHKLIELIFHSIPILRKNKSRLLDKSQVKTETLSKVKEFIMSNLDTRLSLNSIAREVVLNEYTLKTRFKELYGQSVIDFCIEMRLKRAFKEIQTTDKKITSIAYDTGYSSVGNFSNAFYKRYGFRPSELRK